MQTRGSLWPRRCLQANTVCMFMTVPFGCGTVVNTVQNRRWIRKLVPCLLATCYKPLLMQPLVVRNQRARF